jgi:hypothetical protein
MARSINNPSRLCEPGGRLRSRFHEYSASYRSEVHYACYRWSERHEPIRCQGSHGPGGDVVTSNADENDPPPRTGKVRAGASASSGGPSGSARPASAAEPGRFDRSAHCSRTEATFPQLRSRPARGAPRRQLFHPPLKSGLTSPFIHKQRSHCFKGASHYEISSSS